MAASAAMTVLWTTSYRLFHTVTPVARPKRGTARACY